MSMKLKGRHRKNSKNTPMITDPMLKFQNVRLDPARALRPARKKISTLEGQRVMAVLEDAIRRVEIVTLLPYIVENLDRFRIPLGAELVELITHHSVVISSYVEIHSELEKQLQRRATKRKVLFPGEELRQEMVEERGEVEKGGNAEEEADKKEAAAEEGEAADEKEATEDGKADDGKALEEGEAMEEAPEKEAAGEMEATEKGEADKEGATEKKDAADKGGAINEAAADKEGKAVDEGVIQDKEGGSVCGSVQSDLQSGEWSMDSQLEATTRNLGLVAQELSHSIRNVLRGFSLNPVIMTVLEDEMSETSPECQALLQYLREFWEIIMNKLLTTPEEELERMAYLREICKRERLNAAVIDRLEAELKEKEDDKAREIQKKNDTIKRLQTELYQITKFSEEQIRRLRADAEKQEASDEKKSEDTCQQLQAAAAQFRTQLQNDLTEHLNREQALRKKKYKIETEVESWIQKYDFELGQCQDEFEEIDAVYTEEKKQLSELEERFEILEKEYLSIMAQRLLVREKHERMEREHDMLMRSATTIQAVWRSYKVRKTLLQRRKRRKKAAK